MDWVAKNTVSSNTDELKICPAGKREEVLS
jgi:hypothetical protein